MTGLLPVAAGTSLLCDLELLPSPLPALPNKENQHQGLLKSFLLAVDRASPSYSRSTLFRPILALAWPVQYGSKGGGHEDSRDQVRLPLTSEWWWYPNECYPQWQYQGFTLSLSSFLSC